MIKQHKINKSIDLLNHFMYIITTEELNKRVKREKQYKVLQNEIQKKMVHEEDLEIDYIEIIIDKEIEEEILKGRNIKEFPEIKYYSCGNQIG